MADFVSWLIVAVLAVCILAILASLTYCLLCRHKQPGKSDLESGSPHHWIHPAELDVTHLHEPKGGSQGQAQGRPLYRPPPPPPSALQKSPSSPSSSSSGTRRWHSGQQQQQPVVLEYQRELEGQAAVRAHELPAAAPMYTNGTSHPPRFGRSSTPEYTAAGSLPHTAKCKGCRLDSQSPAASPRPGKKSSKKNWLLCSADTVSEGGGDQPDTRQSRQQQPVPPRHRQPPPDNDSMTHSTIEFNVDGQYTTRVTTMERRRRQQQQQAPYPRGSHAGGEQQSHAGTEYDSVADSYDHEHAHTCTQIPCVHGYRHCIHIQGQDDGYTPTATASTATGSTVREAAVQQFLTDRSERGYGTTEELRLRNSEHAQTPIVADADARRSQQYRLKHHRQILTDDDVDADIDIRGPYPGAAGITTIVDRRSPPIIRQQPTECHHLSYAENDLHSLKSNNETSAAPSAPKVVVTRPADSDNESVERSQWVRAESETLPSEQPAAPCGGFRRAQYEWQRIIFDEQTKDEAERKPPKTQYELQKMIWDMKNNDVEKVEYREAQQLARDVLQCQPASREGRRQAAGNKWSNQPSGVSQYELQKRQWDSKNRGEKKLEYKETKQVASHIVQHGRQPVAEKWSGEEMRVEPGMRAVNGSSSSSAQQQHTVEQSIRRLQVEHLNYINDGGLVQSPVPIEALALTESELETTGSRREPNPTQQQQRSPTISDRTFESSHQSMQSSYEDRMHRNELVIELHDPNTGEQLSLDVNQPHSITVEADLGSPGERAKAVWLDSMGREKGARVQQAVAAPPLTALRYTENDLVPLDPEIDRKRRENQEQRLRLQREEEESKEQKKREREEREENERKQCEEQERQRRETEERLRREQREKEEQEKRDRAERERREREQRELEERQKREQAEREQREASIRNMQPLRYTENDLVPLDPEIDRKRRELQEQRLRLQREEEERKEQKEREREEREENERKQREEQERQRRETEERLRREQREKEEQKKRDRAEREQREKEQREQEEREKKERAERERLEREQREKEEKARKLQAERERKELEQKQRQEALVRDMKPLHYTENDLVPLDPEVEQRRREAEEERLREQREEEERQRLLKQQQERERREREENERKQREEQERQRRETEERLRREQREKEEQEKRDRAERERREREQRELEERQKREQAEREQREASIRNMQPLRYTENDLVPLDPEVGQRRREAEERQKRERWEREEGERREREEADRRSRDEKERWAREQQERETRERREREERERREREEWERRNKQEEELRLRLQADEELRQAQLALEQQRLEQKTQHDETGMDELLEGLQHLAKEYDAQSVEYDIEYDRKSVGSRASFRTSRAAAASSVSPRPPDDAWVVQSIMRQYTEYIGSNGQQYSATTLPRQMHLADMAGTSTAAAAATQSGPFTYHLTTQPKACKSAYSTLSLPRKKEAWKTEAFVQHFDKTGGPQIRLQLLFVVSLDQLIVSVISAANLPGSRDQKEEYSVKVHVRHKEQQLQKQTMAVKGSNPKWMWSNHLTFEPIHCPLKELDIRVEVVRTREQKTIGWLQLNQTQHYERFLQDHETIVTGVHCLTAKL